MVRSMALIATLATLVSFGIFVWPTGYRYVEVPGAPPNPADQFDAGTPPFVLRINRYTGRVWRLQGHLFWFNPEEREEIAAWSPEEIDSRCKSAETGGAIRGPDDVREIELHGYMFPCP